MIDSSLESVERCSILALEFFSLLLSIYFETFTKARTMIKVVGRSTLEKIVRSFQISIGTS